MGAAEIFLALLSQQQQCVLYVRNKRVPVPKSWPVLLVLIIANTNSAIYSSTEGVG